MNQSIFKKSCFMKSRMANTLAVSSIAIAISAALSGAPVYAQNAQDNQQQANAEGDQPQAQEKITVTGSRIARREESGAPIQVVDQDDLEIRGALTLGEILQELPSVGASLNGNGSAGTSHGSSTINLRNLGENRALVLVNGNRWVNGAGTRGFRDFVDLNTIPSAIVKSVEVLQDGATAIYGADAIAGVVNIQTYKDYVGSQAKVYYGQASEGDRESVNFDFLHGTDFGSSNLMVALSFADQKPIYSQDRELTRIPLNGLATGTTEGIFREDNLGYLPFYESDGITRNPAADGSDPDNWRAANGDDRYNRWDNNYVVGPLERSSVYAQWVQPFTDVTMRIEALYNNRKSNQQFSPAPPVIRGSRGFMIADDPRVNPFGVEFSGSDFRVFNFFDEVGPRVNQQDVDTMRLGIGFDGYLGATWTWDAFASYARNKAEFVSNNQLDLDRLALGLRACDTTGISVDVSDLAAGCTPVNLFNPLTTQMTDYIRFQGQDSNESRQTHARINFSGPVAQLDAGEILVATGLEYRKEEGFDNPDPRISADPRLNNYRATSSSPREGTSGEYDLYEGYVEATVPLLTNAAMAQDLELNLAARFSDYSTFGSTTNTKVGVLWRVNDDVMFRSNWAEGFRAPSILELFEGQRATFAPVNDPCSGNTSLPGCQGVPSSYTQTDTQEPVTVGGNPDLQPETSDNFNIGMVWTPEAIDGFNLSLDYYDIEVVDTISTFGAQNLLNLCANTGRNCGVITRNGNGELVNIVDGPVNLNSTTTSGFDLLANYRFDNQYGRFDMMLNVSYLNEFEEVSTLADGSTRTEDLVGIARSREAFPELRSNFQLQWQRNDWSATYSLRHIGDTTETFAGDERSIGTVVYHSASAGYEFDNGLRAKFGVNNIGDKQPPASRTNLNINFDINTYNAIGRFYYTQLTYNF
ncbi:Vitamin B12 transporter BtuB [Pseudidiomarina piscicola]|uniref:Vitamin B12 transporter BtuB n=1 Tax=Pseudidiomarina piscicola TaxID=2614830 RepID=A0A6S6WV33_9GAMM|nr:TonB-dependent receptor [Pseudidiomarina piscicola]CAB0151234.1 Vitamin B12 transporter BtuB [Pseudidiomarina piscicola]VZT40740.1 Vitamin B12 transporter BtuB [Pseudomonas aeruginosa]